MSKPKTSTVNNFFKRISNSSMYVCQIDKCNMVISAHSNNLERHIERAHYTVYKRDFLDHSDIALVISMFLSNLNKRTDDDGNVRSHLKVITIRS